MDLSLSRSFIKSALVKTLKAQGNILPNSSATVPPDPSAYYAERPMMEIWQ